ncbi:DUF58 domain-containing protein [Herbivorax sp. ANBcel31]|uniref:DUF58 domain-containing protein n=1 Tax=Herbivorax sp. ANBcel31 TaxID=3069754 RepID=UPI0027B70E0E|nr:DUF58 domain-containing protein [Herbivorax sp. ANBcel31]MDQ2086205.1 DUF58 domain-containing protein [Herbivorax sp. ANBcel31]
MPFSKVFSLLMVVGIIPILIGIIPGLHFHVFVIYNFILIVSFIVDYIMTPGKKDFEVDRICDDKLSMGGENEITISIRNNSDYVLDITALDEIPLYMNFKKKFVNLKVSPHNESEGRYIVVPQKRGQFTFGKIHIKYNGVLKLCSKKHQYDVTNNYKVYPNLKDLNKLGLSLIKKSHLIQGVKKVKSFGGGTEFESLREYNEGDDYRKINWLATARANKLIINTFEPEKNQQVMIMLDSSRVMNSEIDYIKKLDYSINASFLLTDVAIKKGDNVGVMVFDSSVKRYVKPGKGTGQFQLIAENLYNVEENFVSADYRGSLNYLNQYQKRRSLLCIFTELFNAQEAIRLSAALKNMAKHHVPIVITIKDMRLYKTADMNAKNSEDIYLKAASIKLVDEREKVKKVFHNSGIGVIDVPPDKLSVEVVNKYLQMKSFM